jgi:hypothetical protein
MQLKRLKTAPSNYLMMLISISQKRCILLPGQNQLQESPLENNSNERPTKTSKQKFEDEQISFDLHLNGSYRPTVTDLEITDDIDEREGDQMDDLPNVAKYLRRIPCKPSNMNRIIPQTMTNTKSHAISL